MNKVDLLESFLTWAKSCAKWIPTIFIAMTSSWISVQFQIKKKKINSRSEAWWAGIMAFTLSMTVGYIASLKFDQFITTACTAASGVFMKDFITWVFNNHDSILKGLLGKFNIDVNKKKQNSGSDEG